MTILDIFSWLPEKELSLEELGVKASGGVRTKEDALIMIENGATRIGTSNGVDLVK